MTPTPAFNLLDQPWIPVRLRGGQVTELGLLALFERAGDIEALAETSPPNLVALHRLLLAVTHRALCRDPGRWTDADRARWWRTDLPVAPLHAYLEHWRERFWLFHPTEPFMQVAALETFERTADKFQPWTQLALEQINSFANHEIDACRHPAHPGLLLRNMLGYMQFVPGGTVQVIHYSDMAGPLFDSATTIVLGNSLSRTLLLNLHPWSAKSQNDLPAWEKASPDIDLLLQSPTVATGPCSLYARRVRSVLLQQDPDGLVRQIRFGGGDRLQDDENLLDPMRTYQVRKNGLSRLTFDDGRAIWRDLGSLLPDPTRSVTHAAAVLSWAINLLDLVGEEAVGFLVAGLAAKKAKLIRWRMDFFVIPVAALSKEDIRLEMRRDIGNAEEVHDKLREMFVMMWATTMPQPEHSETRKKARGLVDGSAISSVYFSTVEQALPQWFQKLGRGELGDAYLDWNRAVLQACLNAWNAALMLLGSSAAAMKAQAISQGHFAKIIKPLREIVGADDDARHVKESIHHE